MKQETRIVTNIVIDEVQIRFLKWQQDDPFIGRVEICDEFDGGINFTSFRTETSTLGTSLRWIIMSCEKIRFPWDWKLKKETPRGKKERNGGRWQARYRRFQDSFSLPSPSKISGLIYAPYNSLTVSNSAP